MSHNTNTSEKDPWVNIKVPGLEQALEFIPHKKKRVREETANEQEKEIRDGLAREEFLTLFQALMNETNEFNDEDYVRLMKYIPSSNEYDGLRRMMEDKKEQIESKTRRNHCRVERFLLNFAWIVFFLNIYSSLFVKQEVLPSF
jgi:hypothetical protein